MNNKILLGVAISIASLQVAAVPFAPTDARAMAMGGTGVASAKTVHAVQFNPSLLSNAEEEDDFGVLLQGGGYVADEDEFVDSADQFVEDDFATAFEDSVNNIEGAVSSATDSFPAVDAAITAEDLTALSIANAQLASDVTSLKAGTVDLQGATDALNDGLRTLSNKALRGGLGFGAGIAIPSKKFSVAVSANNSTTFSGVLRIAESDLSTLSNYTNATNAYATSLDEYSQASSAATITLAALDAEQNAAIPDIDEILRLGNQLDADQQALSTANDNLSGFNYGGTSTPGVDDGDQVIFQGGELAPGTDEITLESEAHIIAVALTEVALSISREFDFSGHAVAIGISPKLQRMDVYDYIVNVEDDVETDDISDFGVDDTGFNLDIGTSMQFGAEKQGKVGIVFKNLISNELTSVNGLVVEISPQVRAGVSYEAFGWINIAADLDLIENDPVAFEDASQFMALGLELDVFGFMQGRAGYRTNLASTGQEVISLGFGLSPFSLFHIDLGVYTNTSDPEKEVGAVFELGVDW